MEPTRVKPKYSYTKITQQNYTEKQNWLILTFAYFPIHPVNHHIILPLHLSAVQGITANLAHMIESHLELRSCQATHSNISYFVSSNLSV